MSAVLSEDAFRIGGDDIDMSNATVDEGQDVGITGTVREFDATAFERASPSTAATIRCTTRGRTTVLVATNVTTMSGDN